MVTIIFNECYSRYNPLRSLVHEKLWQSSTEETLLCVSMILYDISIEVQELIQTQTETWILLIMRWPNIEAPSEMLW